MTSPFVLRKVSLPGDRTVDQMIQSARSGKKNILEGMRAALTSRNGDQTHQRGPSQPGGIARRLPLYLRGREHHEWDKDSKEALYVRRLGRKIPQTYELYRAFVETRPPEVIANIAICLIHQANYLIEKLRRLEKEFLEEAAYGMPRARLDYRNWSHLTITKGVTPVGVSLVCSRWLPAQAKLSSRFRMREVFPPLSELSREPSRRPYLFLADGAHISCPPRSCPRG